MAGWLHQGASGAAGGSGWAVVHSVACYRVVPLALLYWLAAEYISKYLAHQRHGVGGCASG